MGHFCLYLSNFFLLLILFFNYLFIYFSIQGILLNLSQQEIQSSTRGLKKVCNTLCHVAKCCGESRIE